MKNYPLPVNSFSIKGQVVYIFHNEIAPEVGETIEIQGVGNVEVLQVSDSRECHKPDKTRAKLAITTVLSA